MARGMNGTRSEEHTSELQSLRQLVCRLLLEKKKRLHAGGGRLVGEVADRYRHLHRAEDRHQLDDVLAWKQELDVPAERRDACVFFFKCNDYHRHPHSFPTRRSSD